MSFKDKAFKDRFSDTMWNHSERKFEERFFYSWERFGLGESDDNSTIDTWKLTSFIRHRPDYIVQVGNQLYLMEVQGTGKGGSHKFKQSKLDACKRWNKEHPVYYWLWDDENGRECIMSHNRVMLLIGQGACETGMFDGKRPYFAMDRALAFREEDWGHRVNAAR